MTTTTLEPPVTQADADGPIVEEVRRTKAKLSETYNHSVSALFERVSSRQRASGRTYVDRSLIGTSRLADFQQTPSA
jgi:hypothetical protein